MRKSLRDAVRVRLVAGVLAIIGAGIALPASAVTYVVTGTYELGNFTTEDEDALGLLGTDFRLEVTPGAYISDSGNFTNYSAGSRFLTLSGTDFDGVHSMAQVNQVNWVVNGTSSDSLNLGGSNFSIGGITLTVPTVTIQFAGSFLPTPPPNDLPEFTASDVTNITQGQLVASSTGDPRYRISGLSASVLNAVPSPPVAILVAFGLVGLAARARTRG